jgi:hypothetical protein
MIGDVDCLDFLVHLPTWQVLHVYANTTVEFCDPLYLGNGIEGFRDASHWGHVS